MVRALVVFFSAGTLPSRAARFLSRFLPLSTVLATVWLQWKTHIAPHFGLSLDGPCFWVDGLQLHLHEPETQRQQIEQALRRWPASLQSATDRVLHGLRAVAALKLPPPAAPPYPITSFSTVFGPWPH
jgi:hypothetical protein